MQNPTEVQIIESKLATLSKSRKFWALVLGLVTVAGSYATGQVDGLHALYGALGALSAYTIGTGIEDNGKAA